MFGSRYKFGSELCDEDSENCLDVASVPGVSVDLQRMEMEIAVQVSLLDGDFQQMIVGIVSAALGKHRTAKLFLRLDFTNIVVVHGLQSAVRDFQELSRIIAVSVLH